MTEPETADLATTLSEQARMAGIRSWAVTPLEASGPDGGEPHRLSTPGFATHWTLLGKHSRGLAGYHISSSIEVLLLLIGDLQDISHRPIAYQDLVIRTDAAPGLDDLAANFPPYWKRGQDCYPYLLETLRLGASRHGRLKLLARLEKNRAQSLPHSHAQQRK